MKNRSVFKHVNVYKIIAVCETPLHVGSSESETGEILVHPVSGKPFIQASGLSGCFREYIEKTLGSNMAANWFGSGNASLTSEKTDGRSSIVFTDGVFIQENFEMELRTRVSLDRITGTVRHEEVQGTDKKSGQLLDCEYAAKGSKFEFRIYEYLLDKDNQNIAKTCLSALHHGAIVIGGQLSNGCGKIKLESVKCLSCDMGTKEGRKNWIQLDTELDSPKSWKEIVKEIDSVNLSSTTSWDIQMDVSFDQSVLVKQTEIDKDKLEKDMRVQLKNDTDLPKVMQYMNARKEYVIPGSSIKGALRANMENIAEYLRGNDAKELIEQIFENRSRIYFYDAILNEGKTRIVTRTHIDKFTGGVISGALFKEAVNTGEASICIKVMKGKDENPIWNCENESASMGLLLMTLRDCAIGSLSLGSGYNVGRGFMDVKMITVTESGTDKPAVTIDCQNGQIEVSDSENLISKWLKAAQGNR